MINIDFFKKYEYFNNEELIKFTRLKDQGFSNTNYLLVTSKEKYLIRVFNSKNNINRKFEFETALKAYKKGLGAKPLILDMQNSLMICKFLNGSHKSELKRVDIKNLARLIKKLHKISSYSKPLNLEKTYNTYLKKGLGSNSLQTKKAFKSLKNFKKEYVLCHHDLNPKNILFWDDIKLIDWEYARVNDRYFDLASFIVEFNFNKQEEAFFIRSYFKSTDQINQKKLYMYKIIYKDLCQLWFDAIY